MEFEDDQSLEQFERETDEIYRLMQDLSSSDTLVSEKASKQIEKYVENKKRERDEKELLGIDGIRTVSQRISINEDGEEKRKRLSEEFRKLGNESFRRNDFERAREYYTSAILQYDQNHILYNNRAQAHLKLDDFGESIKDTVQSMKLNPKVIKTYVLLARGLRGQKAYNKALEVLETLKNDQTDLTEMEKRVIEDLCMEIHDEMSKAEEHIKKLKKIHVK